MLFGGKNQKKNLAKEDKIVSRAIKKKIVRSYSPVPPHKKRAFLERSQQRAKNERGTMRDRDEEGERMRPTRGRNSFRRPRATMMGVGDLFFFCMCCVFTTVVSFSSVASSATLPRIDDVNPSEGGILGGGRMYLKSWSSWGGKSLLPQNNQTGTEVLQDQVVVSMIVDDGVRKAADWLHYLSAADKLFVIPPAQTTAIDGLSTDDLSRVLSFCGDRNQGLQVFVDNKKVDISSRKNYKFTKRHFSIASTPFISDVRPREVKAGDIITVFGRTCVADEWETSLEREEKFNASDSDFDDARTRFGLVDMIRVIVGDSIVCETQDPDTDIYYRSSNGKQRDGCSTKGWFQCRIPDDVPAGKYNLKFETTGQGNSFTPAEGYRWSQDNAGESFSLTVLSTSEQQPAKLHDILISDEAEQIKTLNVIGTGMNASDIDVSYGGNPCAVQSSNYTNAICKVNTSTSPMMPILGPIGWLRERWVFRKNGEPLTGPSWYEPLGLSRWKTSDIIMDKLQMILDGTDQYEDAYDAVRVATLIPGAHTSSPYDGESPYLNGPSNAGVSKTSTPSVFERVSGVLNATLSGRIRIRIELRNRHGMSMRVCKGNKPPLSNNDWLLLENALAVRDRWRRYARSDWITVEEGEEYYIEFVIKHELSDRNVVEGGFGAWFDFSYFANDTRGAVKVLDDSEKITRRARSNGDYILRSSAIETDQITIKHRTSHSRSYELRLWNGSAPVAINAKGKNAEVSIKRSIRESLAWATCNPTGSQTDINPDVFHDYHPFDVNRRWISKDSSSMFTSGNDIFSADVLKAGGAPGASIDYSTAYCGSMSQRINLSLLPAGRIIAPPQKNLFWSGDSVPYLNFATKIAPGSNATLIIHVASRGESKTCAILLTHTLEDESSANIRHRACIDLTKVVNSNGEWQFHSINWREALSGNGDYATEYMKQTPLYDTSETVTLKSFGIGAQVFLSGCPSSQRLADSYVGDSKSELSGTMWIDSVSATHTQFHPNRTLVDRILVGNMTEGNGEGISDIDVSFKYYVPRKKCVRHCDLSISLRRIEQCVDSSNTSTAGSFAPYVSTDTTDNGNAPSVTSQIRIPGQTRADVGNLHFSIEGQEVSLAANADASEIKTKLLDVIGGINSTGISVTEVPDLFDVCGVKAHRVRISHASDLEKPQAFLKTESLLGTADVAKKVAWLSRNEHAQKIRSGGLEVSHSDSNDNSVLKADTSMDGYKCGVHRSSVRLFDLRGENATEDACVAECKSNAQCVAFSGIFGSWCIGCRINLDTLHGPAVVAYSKFIRTKTVGEFVANDESPFENTGYVPLGSSAEELGVRPRFKSSEVNLTTAVVRQNGIALPCEVSVDFIEYEKSDLSFDVFGTLIGDVSCALGKMGNSTFGSSSLRRKLLSQLDDDNVEGEEFASGSKSFTTTNIPFPGEDTWAKRDLAMSDSEIEKLKVVFPGNDGEVKTYGEISALKRRSLLDDSMSNSTTGTSSTKIGRFSDSSFWGGTVPTSNSTSIIYVPEGYTLTLDVSDLYFRVWIIEGTLKFDTTMDITMEAEYIIVNGVNAHFTIGSSDAPYEKEAKIKLHGHWRSLGLPKFGVKVIAMTSGRLTFYGKPVVPWTLLEATANAGDNTLVVRGSNLASQGWTPGKRITVTSTNYGRKERSCKMARNDSCEPEEHEIESVTSDSAANTTTIRLKETLQYTHEGKSINIPGAPIDKTVEQRAEVMLLTRNINVCGTDVEGFGAHTMMLSGQMVLEYVEFGPNVGQAFQLGRYAVHYHTPNEKMFKNGLTESTDPKMQGASQALSHMMGCSVHHSFNRALTAHGCYNLTIESNVAYNILGHAMFVEDGIEMYNTFSNNVVSLVHRSFSLLNTDQTPAGFWITNANNRFTGNRVSSSHQFGFWYDPPERPTGPSADVKNGPLELSTFDTRKQPLLQFENNVVHSCGSHGVWIDQIDFQTTKGRQNMNIVGTQTWRNNGQGIGVITGTGHLQIIDTIAMGNSCDIGYVKSEADKWATESNGWEGNLVLNAYLRGDESRSTRAIGAPHGAWVTFKDVLISSYKKSTQPIHHCLSCKSWKGGMEVRFKNISFVDSDLKNDGTQRPRIYWQNDYHSNIFYDADGSLSNSSGPVWVHSLSGTNSTTLGHFPPEYCHRSDVVDGVICNATFVSMREIQFRFINPMDGIPIKMKTGVNQVAPNAPFYHYDHVGRRVSWHMTLVMMKNATTPLKIVHELTFDAYAFHADDPDSWIAEVRELREDEWAVLRFPTNRNPWRYEIAGRKDAAALPVNSYDKKTLNYDNSSLSYSFNRHGSYLYVPNPGSDSSGNLEIMVSGRIGDETLNNLGGGYSTCSNVSDFTINKVKLHGKAISKKPPFPESSTIVERNSSISEVREFIAAKQQGPHCKMVLFRIRRDAASRCYVEQIEAGYQTTPECVSAQIEAHWSSKRYQNLAPVRNWAGYGINTLYYTKSGDGGEKSLKILRAPANYVHSESADIRYDGTTDAAPVCDGNCDSSTKLSMDMKRFDCAPDDPAGCLSVAVQPRNCFDDYSHPAYDPKPREFKWCDTIVFDDDEWKPPGEGEDVVIKAGWTVVLDSECNETNITRHVDVYGSLVIRDPGLGNTAVLRANTIHVAAVSGYLEMGTLENPISDGNVRIELYGNRKSHARFGYGLETKYIAVFGILKLVGRSPRSAEDDKSTHPHTWGTLQSDARLGTKNITIEYQVARAWSVGDELLLGGGTPFDTPVTAEVWNSTDTCEVISIDHREDEEISEVECKDVFKFDHAGPMEVADAEFRGLPVTWMGKTNTQNNRTGHVSVVGMEDESNALKDENYGATVHVFSVKRRGARPSKSQIKEIQISNADNPEKATEVLAAENYDPPNLCQGGQGSAVIANTHFAHCGQRHSKRACLNFDPGLGAQFNVIAVIRSGGSAEALVHNNTFTNTYNFGIRTSNANGLDIYGNSVSNAYHGGFKIDGWSNSVVDNAAVRLLDDIHIPLHDVGAIGIQLTGGGGEWRRNVVASSQWTGLKLDGSVCNENGESQSFDLRAYGAKIGLTLLGGEVSKVNRLPYDAYGRIRCLRWNDIELRGMHFYGIHAGTKSLSYAAHLRRVNIFDAGLGVALWLHNGGSSRDRGGNRAHHAMIFDSIIVGNNMRCDNDGVGFPAFYAKVEPFRPDQFVGTPSRFGGSNLKNVTFANFGQCMGGRNYAIVNSMSRARYRWVYEDVANPVEVESLSFVDTPAASRLLMVKPSRGKIQGADPRIHTCAQMYCDGHRNTFVIDKDGSLTGSDAGTVIPENEIGWLDSLAYVDPLDRETLEDLIPYTAQYLTNGTRIQPLRGITQLYDEAGLYRGDDERCTFNSFWQAYVCPGLKHRQIVIESMDSDQMNRRIAPMSLMTETPHLSGSKRYMSLYTGPALYSAGWSGKVSRYSTIWATGHVGATHTIHFSSTNPKQTRLSMYGATNSERAHIKLYYGTSNRVDVFVDGNLVPPLANLTFENIDDKPDISSQGLLENLDHGANFYNRIEGYLELVLRGSRSVDVIISNQIVLSLEVTVTDDEFYATGIDGLVRNVALLLGISEDRIAIAGNFALGGDRKRRRRGLLSETKKIEIIISEDTSSSIIRKESDSDEDDVETYVSVNEEVSRNSTLELDNFTRTFESASVSDLMENVTGAGSSSSNVVVEEEADTIIPGWTCNDPTPGYGYGDGQYCDCDCGILDPDCDFNADVKTKLSNIAFVRGCERTVEIDASSGESILEFCSNTSKTVSCQDVVDEEMEACDDWPCVGLPSDELKYTIKSSARRAELVCANRTVTNSSVLAGTSHKQEGVCSLALVPIGFGVSPPMPSPPPPPPPPPILKYGFNAEEDGDMEKNYMVWFGAFVITLIVSIIAIICVCCMCRRSKAIEESFWAAIDEEGKKDPELGRKVTARFERNLTRVNTRVRPQRT